MGRDKNELKELSSEFASHVIFLPGFSAVMTHSQLSVIHLKLWPISNIPDDEVTIFEPQDFE